MEQQVITNEVITNLIYQIVLYAVGVSYVAEAMKETIKTLLKKVDLHPWVNIALVYVFGIVSGFLIRNLIVDRWYLSLVFGFLTACISIIIYKSALSSINDLIPALKNKFFGNSSDQKKPDVQ